MQVMTVLCRKDVIVEDKMEKRNIELLAPAGTWKPWKQLLMLELMLSI